MVDRFLELERGLELLGLWNQGEDWGCWGFGFRARLRVIIITRQKYKKTNDAPNPPEAATPLGSEMGGTRTCGKQYP